VTLPLDLASSSRIFNCSMVGQALELQLDDACACFSLKSKLATRPSRASFGVFEARISVITASRLSSAFLNPSRMCSRSRALAEQVFRPAAHHFQTVLDKALDNLDQAQLPRLPVDNGTA